MTISVMTRLDRKYMLPGTIMIDPYTEEKDGHLYLVVDSPAEYCTRHAILCDSIVSIESL